MKSFLAITLLLGASAAVASAQYSSPSPATTYSPPAQQYASPPPATTYSPPAQQYAYASPPPATTYTPSAQQGWQQIFSGLQSMSSGYVQQGQKWGQQIQSELSQLSSYSPVQLETYVEQYQQQYCTPASITPEMKMPGNYTGTSIVLSFQLGNCTFSSDWTSTKEIECEQPSLVYIKSPAVLTAPYKTPVKFTDQECVISKSFGSNETQVLYTFDDKSQPLDYSNLASNLQTQLSSMMTGYSTQQQVPAVATPTPSIVIPTVSSIPAGPVPTAAPATPASSAATAATGGTATGAASG